MREDGCAKRHIAIARRQGFTLVELILAAAITLVLAMLMIVVISGMLGSWNRSRGALTTANQARLVLGQLAQDLQGAIYRADGNVWLAATIQSDSALANHGWTVSHAKPDTVDVDGRAITDCRFGRGGVWLRFFTHDSDLHRVFDEKGNPVIDPATGEPKTEYHSAPCATAYQIVRQRVGATAASHSWRYMLFRSRVRSTTRDPVLERPPDSNSDPAQDAGTFQAGFNLHPGLTNAYHQANETDDKNRFSLNPDTITRPHRNTAMAMNVIDFGVRLFARDGTLLYPTPIHNEHLAAFGGDAFPDRIEVFLRVLTDEGADLIENLENGRIPGDWWDIAVAHSQVFTRSIRLVTTLGANRRDS